VVDRRIGKRRLEHTGKGEALLFVDSDEIVTQVQIIAHPSFRWAFR
jgi:hypothetical protein